MDADLLVASRRDFQVDLIGPAKQDLHWQAREKTGFASERFFIDWKQEQATCPEDAGVSVGAPWWTIAVQT